MREARHRPSFRLWPASAAPLTMGFAGIATGVWAWWGSAIQIALGLVFVVGDQALVWQANRKAAA